MAMHLYTQNVGHKARRYDLYDFTFCLPFFLNGNLKVTAT